ncbi:putative N-acetyltransferase [Heterostelium album PN500]|uniref:Putative N-acetyltransferase n=1 Tax=Heterostelium pallidum (strain ATCC 26659 / Pp 5 / PN500) TaxID=670386 RepID=D3BIV1_HETP5|nr:putative N-acetyltransferase [Heterostelium album PN500]EFA78725.1 putative N-acetyltransferase [Heterostelium album PN500]|eukprot:XP_020430849.1 putative N-acetyltransferase [Heterostelium album PN500]
MFNVYQAKLEDVTKILPLYLGYRRFYKVDESAELAEQFLRDRIGQGESIVYYVAEEAGGQPVGFAQLYPLFCSLAMKRIWLLYDLFVAPEARQQGIAKLLLNRADQLGKETNSAFIMLSTATDNTKAQSLYESHGYIRDNQFYTYNKTC